MKKFLTVLFVFCCFSLVSQAGDLSETDIIITEKDGELYIEDTSVKALETLFKKIKYKDYIHMPSMAYPAIFLKTLPKDFSSIEDESYRNRLFIQMLTPIAVKVNEDIFEERKAVFEMSKDFDETKELTPEQEEQLNFWAEKYDIFTPFKGFRRVFYIFDELKKKVDVVPPSILVASAAIESNWGTSRPAIEANALYKEKIWFGEEPGLPSLEDDDYEYKIFDSIYDAMYSYATKINSNVDFDYMRHFRSNYRKRGRYVAGRELAHAMLESSALKNYAGLLDYTITFYEMQNLDIVKLMRLPEKSEQQ